MHEHAPGDRASALVRELARGDGFDHRVGPVDVVETHISWVLLTGDYAYKIKKPVALPFLDFTTLERRRRFCALEVELNRRLAAELYLGIVPITRVAGRARVGGGGAPVEWAVRMRQFASGDRLDRVLARGALDPPVLQRLAERLARFHAAADRADVDTRFANSDRLHDEAMANFDVLRERLADTADEDTLDELSRFTRRSLGALEPVFLARRRAGAVRECHGDLHLANVALIAGQPVAFDCIEFDPALRFVDVISEIAFLTMDLHARGRPDLGWTFLDAYLAETGDYEGLAVLRHYQVYRALVRAKIGTFAADPRAGVEETSRNLRAAASLARDPTSTPLVIMRGVSGSGKSWLSERLAAAAGAVRVRSDVERRRLLPDRTERYRDGATDATYRRLESVAEEALRARYPVIVDATFLDSREPARFRALAERAGVPFRILAPHVDRAELERRIAARTRIGGDASEADLEVLSRQLANLEPLAPEEARHVLAVGAGASGHLGALARAAGFAPV